MRHLTGPTTPWHLLLWLYLILRWVIILCMPLKIILLQPKILTSLPLCSNHAFFWGLPMQWCHYIIFVSTTRDFTCHTIPTLSFTNFTRINRQVSILIQSLSSLGDRVSTGQFLIIGKLMQWKSKAIWQIMLHPGTFNIWGSMSRCLSWCLPQVFVYHW